MSDDRACACLLVVEIHLNAATNLKAKRMVVRHLLDAARQRYGVAASETGYHDKWQRAELGFAAVGASPSHVGDVLDTVERFVWSHPEVAVLSTDRRWTDE